MAYYANFSTRNFELRAYEELEESVKDGVAPVVTLTRTNRATTFEPVLGDVLAAARGREVIVDFDPVPRPMTSAQEAEDNRRRKAAREQRELRDLSERTLAYHSTLREETETFNAALRGLTDRASGGRAWLALAGARPNVVPVVQLVDGASVAAQVALANERELKVAFRPSSLDPAELALAAQGIARLADPANSVLLLEAGHRRGDGDGSVRRVDAALRGLRASIGEGFNAVRKVAVAGSFPGGSLRDHPRSLAIEKIRLHRLVAGDWDVSYGDHASIQPRSDQAGGNGWFPHVDLVNPASWEIDIDDLKSSRQGYVNAAARAVAGGHWNGRVECWGTRMVFEGSEGRLEHPGIKLTTPAPWLAVRMNQHMTRMARR